MFDGRGLVASLLLLSAVTVPLITPNVARGDDASPPPLAGDRAVDYANKGLEHFAARQWEEAYEAFRMADGIVPSLPFQLYMARARREQQRLIEARAIYKKIVEATVPEGAPPTFKQAQVDAKAELATVEGGIATVVVTASGSTEPVSVTIDGKAVPAGAATEVDPGERVVVAIAGSLKREIRKAIQPGQKNVAIALRFDEVPAAPPASSDRVSLAPWGWALGAVGAASAIAGAVMGGVALSKDSSISERCTPSCPESERAEIESEQSTMFTLADASTGTLIAGGVLLAAGITLLVVDVTQAPDGPEVRAELGPSGGALRVRF